MKKMIIILALLTAFVGCDIVDSNFETPTKVYLTEKYLADYKIYVVSETYKDYDEKIEITSNRHEAQYTAFIVDQKYNADKIVFITNY